MVRGSNANFSYGIRHAAVVRSLSLSGACGNGANRTQQPLEAGHVFAGKLRGAPRAVHELFQKVSKS